MPYFYFNFFAVSITLILECDTPTLTLSYHRGTISQSCCSLTLVGFSFLQVDELFSTEAHHTLAEYELLNI